MLDLRGDRAVESPLRTRRLLLHDEEPDNAGTGISRVAR